MLCFQVVWVRSYLFKALGLGYILRVFTPILPLSPFRQVFILPASCSSHSTWCCLFSLNYFSSLAGTVIPCRKWSLSCPFHAPVASSSPALLAWRRWALLPSPGPAAPAHSHRSQSLSAGPTANQKAMPSRFSESNTVLSSLTDS